ncbi:hypothetical protein OJF2_00080 [Aquisphaera giovannonii]|uniref:Uncharacterized protein n=1 Tax=Aquisphaera giovannonii TaxID=406548 RepID=A0A5B9VT53_9BACT|nr:hypothetical protein [Aquisphaera giovannonii]QEH31543.1 hypothetical protein OJF2_00080 [Aquisphaera giovannonii]
MSHELHYTSVPRGLLPGSRGFCTVACTAGMPGSLRERLEGLSGYRPAVPPHDPDAALNPVAFSHHRLALGGRSSSVLSRVSAAGLDYSSRPNKHAHHVVLGPEERPEGGPAWLLMQPGFLEASWHGEPATIEAGRVPPRGDRPPGIARAWGAIAGDPGWAGVLAEAFLADPSRVAALVFRPGMDLLPLFAEAIALLPPSRRWDVDFNTYFTGLPQGLSCAWRGVLAGSPEADQSARLPNCLRIDLTARLPKAEGGDLVHLARTGERRAGAPAPARPRPSPAGPRRPGGGDGPPIEMIPLPPDAPHARAGRAGRLEPEEPPGRGRGLVALIAAACLILAGGGGLWLVGPDRLLGALGLRSKAADAILAAERENAEKKQAAADRAPKAAESSAPQGSAAKAEPKPAEPAKPQEPTKVAGEPKPQEPKGAEVNPPPEAPKPPADTLGEPRSRPVLFAELPRLTSGLDGRAGAEKPVTIATAGRLGSEIGRIRLLLPPLREGSPIAAQETDEGLKICQNTTSTLGENSLGLFTKRADQVEFRWSGLAASRPDLAGVLRKSLLEIETAGDRAYVLLRASPLTEGTGPVPLVEPGRVVRPNDYSPRGRSFPWMKEGEASRPVRDARRGEILVRPEHEAADRPPADGQWPLYLDRWRIDVKSPDAAASTLLVGGAGHEPCREVQADIGESRYAAVRLQLDGPNLMINLAFNARAIHDDKATLDAIPGRRNGNAERLGALEKERASARKGDVKDIDEQLRKVEKEDRELEETRKRLESYRAELERIMNATRADLSFTVVLKLDDDHFVELAQFGKYAEDAKRP